MKKDKIIRIIPLDLQKFAEELEAVQGKRIIYLYRIYEATATTDAKAIAFATENENSLSRDAEVTQTKNGPIRTPGAIEIEVSLTSILAKGDDMIEKVKKAVIDGSLVELWEVNLDEEGETENVGKYKATYYQGYFSELSITSNAEESVEVSMTFGPNGTGASGYATVTDDQQEIASYAFKDTKKESE
jgi:TP901-1 family phage major tail protein